MTDDVEKWPKIVASLIRFALSLIFVGVGSAYNCDKYCKLDTAGYLIGLGAVNLATPSLVILVPERYPYLGTGVDLVLNSAMFAAGSLLVLRSYATWDSTDTDSLTYCHPVPMNIATAEVSLVAVIICLALLYFAVKASVTWWRG